MSARLLCHKRLQPDLRSRDERIFGWDGETICRFLCGEKEIGRAVVWKDDDVVFQQWRMRITLTGQEGEKLVKGGSPKGLVKYIKNNILDRIDCSKVGE